MSDLQSAIARLTEAYTVRTRVASPVTARRKPTDTPPPVGTSQGYGNGRASNTMANRANGGGSCYYKPRTKDLVGAQIVTPPTERPSPKATVRPAGNIKLGGPATVVQKGKREPSAYLQAARATGANNGMRTQLAAQHNLAVATGDYPLPGVEYGASPDTRIERVRDHEAREEQQEHLRGIKRRRNANVSADT